MLPSLAWVAEFHASFNRAAEITSRFSVEDTVNPLIKNVVFHLDEPLGKNNYQPFQTLAHAFAKANNSILLRIHSYPDRLVLVIALKRRFGPEQKKNPLVAGDKPGLLRRG